MIHVDISKLYNLSSCSLLCCGPKKTKKGGEKNGGRVKLKDWVLISILFLLNQIM